MVKWIRLKKIPNVINLATTTALNTVEKKIPNVGNLVKKTNYNINIRENKKNIADNDRDKYITTQEFNKLMLYFIIPLSK